jgi:hypothetical protein
MHSCATGSGTNRSSGSSEMLSISRCGRSFNRYPEMLDLVSDYEQAHFHLKTGHSVKDLTNYRIFFTYFNGGA